MELPTIITFVANALNMNGTKFYDCYDAYNFPEINMTLPEIVRYNGYPVETHKVTTDDGYILTVFRIPHGRRYYGRGTPKREPILVQHGFLSSANNWIMNNENQSLGYMLADRGYDVWLANIRGNSFSREHKNYTTNETEFWNFSWEDMAEYDLPAMINYILDKTNRTQLVYIGYSQGSLMGFAKFSSDSEIAAKVRLFIALAPVATLSDITTPMRFMAPFTWTLKVGFLLGGYKPFGLFKNWLNRMKEALIRSEGANETCSRLFFNFIPRARRNNLDAGRIPLYLSRIPDDTSIKNVVHYGQMVSSGLMQRYDYGFWNNYRKYGQLYPPVFKPEDMNVTTVIFWSSEDHLSRGKDLAKLFRSLKNFRNYRVNSFNHIDYSFSYKAADLVYNKMFQILDE